MNIENVSGEVIHTVDGDTLVNADLTYADLTDANLRGAHLRRVELMKANLTGAKIDYQIQGGLLEQIAELILSNHDKLDMNTWHSDCGTTHCLAGWACQLNPVTKRLEKTQGTELAALLTLGAEAHSHFFDKDDVVLAFLKTKLN